MTFTAVYMQVPEGYIAFVEELPGANTQGATLEDARKNLQDAVALFVRLAPAPASISNPLLPGTKPFSVHNNFAGSCPPARRS